VLTLGSDRAKLLLFQGLLFGLRAHFSYRNGRHKAAPALEEHINCPLKSGDVVLGSPRCRPRSTQTTGRLVVQCLRSILLRPIHDSPFEIVATMGDAPGKAGHEITVGVRHRFSALDRAFHCPKAPSKGL
jgi:hypothetical protein